MPPAPGPLSPSPRLRRRYRVFFRRVLRSRVFKRLRVPAPPARNDRRSKPIPAPALNVFVAVFLALSLAGYALSTIWLTSALSPVFLLGVAFPLTFASWHGFMRGGTGQTPRVARFVVIAFHLLATYLAVMVGIMLGWTTPIWFRGISALLLLLAALPVLRGRRPLPLIFPLGLWIAVCLAGWWREDGVARCEDFQNVLKQPGVSIPMPSSLDLPQCQAGESLQVSRYPRRVWESPTGESLVVLTQPGIARLLPPGRPAGSIFGGSVCRLQKDHLLSPECFGEGKSQVLFEDPANDKLFVAGWSLPGDQGRGVLFDVPLHGDWQPRRTLHFQKSLGEGYVDPALDIAGFAFDEGEKITFVRPSTMEIIDSQAGDIIPEASHYDATRHEGVFCGSGFPGSGLTGLAVGYKGWPLEMRPLGHSWRQPWNYLGLLGSCDWDPAARRVQVSMPNLGLLSTIDYDSGAVLQTSYVGIGTRHLVIDRPLDRVYVSNFLTGEVQAIDAKTGERLASWFVGRFVRFLNLSRDGKTLYAPSTLGVVSIALN